MERFEVVIIGAGMAGASLAWALAPARRVLLLERESQPGYHSTGRSAATLHRSYGNAAVRALTAASAPFYLDPPAGFSEVALASPRGVLVVARADQLEALEAEIRTSRRFVPEVARLDRDGCLALAPSLRPDYVAAGMLDPTLVDLDVGAILAGFLKGARAKGAVVRADARLHGLARDGAGWRLALADSEIGCDVVVDAAGAWADTVA
jgi:D-arginine dehydrogenase